MAESKLREYLQSQNVEFTVIKHQSPVYTAQEIAASAHIPGKELAKTVMIKLDGELAMTVLPASYRVDFKLLQDGTGATKVELASEREFKGMFPDCEVGAMPPFGNLYGMTVYAAESLAEEVEIAFCGGTHTELIRMSFQDFKKLASPKIMKFSVKGN